MDTKGVFFTAVTIFLCDAPYRDWNLEEEMQGWGVGEDRLATFTARRDSARRAMNDAWSHWPCHKAVAS